MPPEHSGLTRTVLVNGLEFHHIEVGQGCPLVVVHAEFGDWRAQLPRWNALAPNHRCIIYGRRYGAPNCNRITSSYLGAESDAEDLCSLLIAWNASPAVLIATESGAATAQALIRRWPHMVRSLMTSQRRHLQSPDLATAALPVAGYRLPLSAYPWLAPPLKSLAR